ncbi:hypothetical protein D3C76_1345890 [compost metagenome]
MHRSASITRNKYCSAIQCRDHCIWIHFFLETKRCFRAKSQLTRGFTNGSSVKLSGFQNEIYRLSSNFRILTSHYSSQSYCFYSISDNEHMWLKLPFLAIKCSQDFTFMSKTNAEFSAFYFICIKSMKRLSVFEHHIVSDVYDVVNWTNPCRHQTILNPQR